jgi:hypothetical protein
VNAADRRIAFTKAALPGFLEWLRIENLSVADVEVDLLLTRHTHDVSVTVLRRTGDVSITTFK